MPIRRWLCGRDDQVAQGRRGFVVAKLIATPQKSK